jgi:hypothetical protein
MIVVFAWAYPAGLAIYWVTGNIFMIVMQYFIGGWGQLFTSPFSIPYPANTMMASTPQTGGNSSPSRARSSVIASDPQPVRERPTPRPAAPAQQPLEGDVVDGNAGSGGEAATHGKMERYQARHGRAAARGRPSAKGAKK